MSTGLVRCAPGSELVSALASQVPPDSWVRGFGVVRDLAVTVEFAGSGGPAVRHEGTAQIASLDAFVGPDGALVSVVASVPVAGTFVIAAGRLERAIVVDMWLVAQTLVPAVQAGALGSEAGSPASVVSPATVRAAAAPPAAPARHASAPAAGGRPAASTPPARPSGEVASGRPTSPERSAALAPRPTASAGPGAWAQVAALSERVASSHGDEPDPVEVDELERGDILVHPTLGRCAFLQGIDTDAARVKLPNGSPQKLMLRVFDIVPTDHPRTFLLRKRE